MRFRKLFLIAALVSLLAVVPGLCYGQSESPAAPQQPPAASAPPQQTPPQAQAAPLANAKPAKVWTNDEIDTLRNNHGVSVVGNPNSLNVSATSKAYSQEKDPAWYRKQLASLRAEIDELDPQIAKLKAFLSGENVSDPPTQHHRLVPTPQDQLKQLEAKRQADEAKIEDLLDRARHNGIEPGALR
jgi:cell division protein FtsB